MKKTNYLVEIIFLIFVLLILIYRSNEGFDILAPQFFFLSILGTCYFLFIGFKNRNIFFQGKYLISTLFLSITLIGLISSIWAYNKIESFITAGQFFTIYLIFYIFLSLPDEKNFIKYFAYFILIFSFYEVSWSLKIFLQYFFSEGYTGRNLYFAGMSANPNITAFSVAIKLAILPLITEKILHNRFIKLLSYILMILSIFIILLMGSRGGYLALFLLIIGTLSYFIFTKNLKKLTFNSIIFLLGILIFVILNNNKIDVIEKLNTININTVDGSIDQRLRYYKFSLDIIKENPLGIGLGNWKLESIERDKEFILDFIIPYHCHNDLLEITSETGILGGLIFISIFILLFKQIFKNIFFRKEYIFMLVGLIIYVLDSNLNFPIFRPLMTINLSLLLFLIFNYEK